MTPSDTVPAGFERLPSGLGFTDTLQPIYRCVEDGQVRIGLRVEAHHSNSLGICHGGVLMTLADIAAASAVNLAAGKLMGNPTLNLAVDFVNSANQGDWIESRPGHVEAKRRFGFASGTIHAGERVIARYNATIYLPDHDGMLRPGAPGHGALADLED